MFPWSALRSSGADPLASMAGPAFPRRTAGSGLPAAGLARGTGNPGPWSAGVLVASVGIHGRFPFVGGADGDILGHGLYGCKGSNKKDHPGGWSWRR